MLFKDCHVKSRSVRLAFIWTSFNQEPDSLMNNQEWSLTAGSQTCGCFTPLLNPFNPLPQLLLLHSSSNIHREEGEKCASWWVFQSDFFDFPLPCVLSPGWCLLCYLESASSYVFSLFLPKQKNRWPACRTAPTPLPHWVPAAAAMQTDTSKLPGTSQLSICSFEMKYK